MEQQNTFHLLCIHGGFSQIWSHLAALNWLSGLTHAFSETIQQNTMRNVYKCMHGYC